MKDKRGDGESVRPSLVLIGDPRTDERARRPGRRGGRYFGSKGL
jgi:hypothetical protein